MPAGGGPRCLACHRPLEGHVGYRVLRVPAVEEDPGSRVIDVVFIYCPRCGMLAAHPPAGEIGGAPPAVVATGGSTPIQLNLNSRQLAGTVPGGQVRLDLGERSHDMTVAGTFAGAAVDARVVHDDNAASATGLTALLEGSFDDQQVDIHAGVSGDLRARHVLGAIGQATVRLPVNPDGQVDGQSITLTGVWDGPLASLALAAGVILNFM